MSLSVRALSWVFVFLAFACAKNHPADTIIKGGVIYTSDPAHPTVEAVAIAGDTIIYAGSLAELSEFEGSQTKIIDLKGQCMTPGFIESHGHMMALGNSELTLDLSHVKSYGELVQKVKEAAAKAAPGEWITGGGWHQDKWDKLPDTLVKGFQTHHLLSSVTPDNPVYLEHVSGHAAFVNAKAMQLAGVNVLSIEKLTKDLGEGGDVVRDALGNPTGIFVERAETLISGIIPATTEEQARKMLGLAMTACLKNGITSFQDAGEGGNTILLYKKFKENKELHVRMYVMINGEDSELLQAWYKHGPEVDPQHLLTVRSIKLHCDGALGSRGAWLTEEYSDRKGYYGMATLSMDSVLKISRTALEHGFQVCSHAIGDRANHEILDRYEKAFSEFPVKAGNARFRIEHAQHLLPSDIPRFGKLGVIASMQAIHLSSDRPWAIQRLGESRINSGAYMWHSLLASGAKVINGTDVPVEPVSPVANFYASVTRMTLAGEPNGGFEPAEKMTREEALRAYTLDAAYGAFEEHIKGSIEKGKLADFTVFSQDIMKVTDESLLKTEVVMTILGGKVAYARDSGKK